MCDYYSWGGIIVPAGQLQTGQCGGDSGGIWKKDLKFKGTESQRKYRGRGEKFLNFH